MDRAEVSHGETPIITKGRKEASMRIFCLITAVSLVISSAFAADEPQVPYPEGYRDWHHVKSMVINPGHPLYESFGGIHHIYANELAVKGYQQGKFPEGAVIIFDLLEAKKPITRSRKEAARWWESCTRIPKSLRLPAVGVLKALRATATPNAP
jgi:cytochrome P460